MKRKETGQSFEHELLGAELGSSTAEVDLHGMDVLDAQQTVESKIQEAYMSGDRVIRIIHGRGNGILRTAVHKMLSNHQMVEFFKDGQNPSEVGAVSYAVIIPKD